VVAVLKAIARHPLITVVSIIMVTVGHLSGHASAVTAAEKTSQLTLGGSDEVLVERIAPQEKSGVGYRLVYRVDAPIDVYWKFKTDFDNAFLVENQYIRDHRFINQRDNVVITENRYTYGPDVAFRWQTTIIPEMLRLDFILLNPEKSRQRYHNGFIELAPDGSRTRVTQIAYFDFWGAGFWAYNPFKGGMKDILVNTARWEQATVLRIKNRYDENSDQRK
jgi:hypothetical protein